ncbi:MAG TPA: hypothetical protein VIV60_34730, partial [Polyangiaceae bacterium]
LEVALVPPVLVLLLEVAVAPPAELPVVPPELAVVPPEALVAVVPPANGELPPLPTPLLLTALVPPVPEPPVAPTEPPSEELVQADRTRPGRREMREAARSLVPVVIGIALTASVVVGEILLL